MLDDLESNLMKGDQKEITSSQFVIKPFNIPGLQQSINILSISSSKKYIYLLTDTSELLRIESTSLKPIQQAYSIISSISSSIPKFNETLNKIWTDRVGNHSIIRYNGRIYYFNSKDTKVKELKSLAGIEVCAVGFDDRNENEDSTGNFLVTDYYNNIYECNISITIQRYSKDFEVVDQTRKLIQLTSKDDEDGDDLRDQNDRIYGIRFFKATKINLGANDNARYIVAVTKNRLYQFRGPGEQSFSQIFMRYEKHLDINDSCKYFPTKKKNFRGSDLDILYRSEQRNVGNRTQVLDVMSKFGWKTESGFCFGNFTYDSNGLPNELKSFTVVPFAKISSSGTKDIGEEPNSVVHTNNHIFILYKDCLTVISKLTSNIIHTQYLNTEYSQMIYNEFSPSNGNIFLISKKGLFQISLKEENNDIWEDYLEIGDYDKAKNYCHSEEIKKKINTIDAEVDFYEKKNGFNAANKFVNSDERFEIICLEYLMRDDIDGLKMFLELYKASNLNKDENNQTKSDKIQLNLINTWILDIFLNELKVTNLGEFRSMIRENQKNLDSGVVYNLLKSNGKMAELVEYATLKGDLEKVISFYINRNDIDMALEQLTLLSNFRSDKILSQIFLDNCQIFFRKKPKDTISLMHQRFKDVDMKKIVLAIISATDSDKNSENAQTILTYLKSLIEKPKIEEENNIHNLYIYYLSKNKANQDAIIEYLKGPLKDKNAVSFQKKKEVLFQLDYAKKLFKDNPPAYSLVLALMGKYSDAVRILLNQQNDDCKKIAKFIASNTPGETLKKQLWIDIFSYDSQKDFQKSLEIMKESKILKIEDILPHITDTIKIEEFKKQISNCINEYEENIKNLKDNISKFNKTAENIDNDIYKAKKESIEIEYSNCKCEICNEFIKDKNIFLFPCGHMFDMNCIRDYLLNYEITGLDNIHEKNIRIDELFFELGYSKKRTFINKNDNEIKKKENEIPEKDKKRESSIFGRFMNFAGFGKADNKEQKNDEASKALENELIEILSEQCILCGDFLVDSIQNSFTQKERKELEKDGVTLKFEREPEFDL